jgi:GT2 family glycosyltransferase
MMQTTTPTLTLHPALPGTDLPTWDGAEWIGEVWVDDIEAVAATHESTGLPVECQLERAVHYGQARLLVRTVDRPLGFVKIGVSDGTVDFSELERRVANIPCSEESGGRPETSVSYGRSATVVLCTRDRPALLRTALESLLAVDYPELDIIVVDNAPETDATRKYVIGLSDPRVRVINEPRPGLSRARNTGLSAATGDIVAFTDDDVVVDRYWLRALLDGFSRGTLVSCVCGIVPAGEIRTPAQAFFDRRVGWSEFTVARVFDWEHPPRDIPLFPFAVRRYGAGANFAVEREVVLGFGGFDEALGAGTAAGGGEDIDMFFRILRSGRQLVHDPAAIVWHRHRADSEGLLAQTRGYGLGLGAWLAKITGDPETARLAIKTAARHAPAFVRHMRAAAADAAPPDNLAAHLPTGIGNSTWKSIVTGMRAYRSARRSGNLTQPLLGTRPQEPSSAPNVRVGQS